MSEPDLYKVLGLKPTATAAQIKRAYHECAKTAHPDAGGSAEAMAQVNEAYETLIDPIARRLYDDHADEPAETHEEHDSHHSHGGRPRRYITDDPHAAERREAARINRERTSWARSSGWEMARVSATAAVAAVVTARFLPHIINNKLAVFAGGIITFIPVYFLILSFIFITNPPLRLVFADLVRRHPTSTPERADAIALIVAFFPLAVAWLFIYGMWI